MWKVAPEEQQEVYMGYYNDADVDSENRYTDFEKAA